MAESSDRMPSKPSKIPRYVRSNIPICSIEYKKVLRDVKSKRLSIESKECEVKFSKKHIETLSERVKTRTSGCTSKDTDSNATRTPTKSLLPKSGSIRSVIITPKGTKRKVNPTYSKFKMDLNEILQKHVRVDVNEELTVEELFSRLEKEAPSIKRLEKAKILRTVSDIFKTKLKRRGKKREGYYSGLALVDITTGSESSDYQIPVEVATSDSPVSKVRREKGDSDITEITTPICKGPLKFSDEVFSSTPHSDQHMEDISTKLDNLAVSYSGCSPTSEEEPPSLAPAPNMNDELCSLYALVDKLNGNIDHLKTENDQLKQDIVNVEQLLADYDHSASDLVQQQDDVIQFYKEITDSGRLLGGLLSLSERNIIAAEVDNAKQIFNLGLRNKDVKDLIEVFDPLLFNKILDKLKKECPTITNILEQLLLTANASRNTIKTPSMKMKAGVHLLASLLDIRDQRSGNDLPVLFGLLCMCYGAGPSMIEILQHLGLSESFPVLKNILQQQLTHYKEIIGKRVQENSPVVTYQDNMQLARTSMRHLRLSKLQKDKVKQGKMWDFTVRGWREADISGLENLFEDPETATTQQRDVKTMIYAETKIEANPEHNAKWQTFKERNLLRKMNLALNGICMSSQEIISSSNEELQCQATSAAEKQKQAVFILDIPSADEEHPDLSDKPTRIFPLPISHENQCKILGVANNLELFSNEFGFSCKKEEKFLPLMKSGKEFDLDRAYQRYSFMKALERHKEEQNKYVQILRMEEENLQPSNEEDSDDQLLEAIIDIEPTFDLESDFTSGDEFEQE